MLSAVMSDRGRSLVSHAFLVVILCLLAVNVDLFFRAADFGYGAYTNLAVGLSLLFNHLAFAYVKEGAWGRAMKWLSLVWVSLTLVYVLTVYQSLPST